MMLLQLFLTLVILAWVFSLRKQVKLMAGELERLTTEVSETRGALESAITLIKGFKKALDDAIAAGNPAALTALSDSLDQGQQELAQAIVDNPLPPTP